MSRSTAILVAIVAQLLWMSAGFPRLRAGEDARVLDQCIAADGDIGVATRIGDTEISQTFRVGVTGILTAVELRVRRSRDDIDLSVSVVTTTEAGSPAVDLSSTLGAVVVSSDSIPPASTPLTAVDLEPLRIVVREGELLAIVLHTGEVPPFGLAYQWDGLSQNTYTEGTAFSRPFNASGVGGDWQELSFGTDLGLKTYVRPVTQLLLPGDANLDGRLDLSDPISLLSVLFRGAEAPCDRSGTLLLLDFDGNGELGLTDAVIALHHLFRGGPPHVLGTACVVIPRCETACGRAIGR